MILPTPQSDISADAIKMISRCPVCAANYGSGGATCFAQFDAARLVHLTCAQCQSFFVAMIVTLGQGISSVGMVTDLSLEDAKRLYQSDPISIDELIDGYQVIEQGEFLRETIAKKGFN
jgi:hypothetical protein